VASASLVARAVEVRVRSASGGSCAKKRVAGAACAARSTPRAAGGRNRSARGEGARMKLRCAMLVTALALGALPSFAAGTQDDAATGADAGDTFATATPLPTHGHFDARLDRTGDDADDYYGFTLAAGESFSTLVSFSVPTTDPVELLDPNGVVVDTGARVASAGVASSSAFTAASVAFSPSGEVSNVRVTVHRALFAGMYRLHVQARQFDARAYELCVMNCDDVVDAGIQMIFGGSLPTTKTRVLLVPPSHGDLGNPLGPTVLDYIDATLRGIRTWKRALASFANDHPEFDYLKRVTIEVEIFDGAKVVDPAGYDVVIGYVAAGPAFRGIASDSDDTVEEVLAGAHLSNDVHFSGRVIALSLFGSSPRAGQVAYDFPEINDLENVTVHEFGHTFGLGHTTTWTRAFGPDMMNSPAPFVYGDGSPVGDGGERTPLKCLSSLDLYGMAQLYRWIPDGGWAPSYGSESLPDDIAYAWYC
jgi:hypothetical protein